MPDQTLIELLRGKGAHSDPVACVEDLLSETAGRKIEGWPHTIWELIGHMNYWMDYEIKRIQGEPWEHPAHAAESWPADPAPGSASEWKDAVLRFAELIGQLSSLAQSGPDILARPVVADHAQQSRISSSVHAVLWQMAAHNSYHLGQIAMIRRALGVWPPPGGGDTW